jgi:tryptophan-rich sensory protein
VSAIGYIWIAVEVVGLVDVFRHSSADWSYAERNRSFWLIFMFFFGPIFVVPYLFLVRPRFPGAAERPDQAFRKP